MGGVGLCGGVEQASTAEDEGVWRGPPLPRDRRGREAEDRWAMLDCAAG